MESKSFCQMCGREADQGAAYCAHCGARLPAPIFVGSTASTPVQGAGDSTTGADVVPQAPTNSSFASPYAAPAWATARGPRYGGFWIRFVAIVIDAIVIQVVVLPVSFILGGMIGVASVATRMPTGGAQLVGAIVGGALGVVAGWIYEAAMESSSKQATLGKMLFGLRVTDLNDHRISFARATGRHFAKYLSGVILMIGYIMAGFTEKKQALHDILAGTIVRYGT